MRKRRSSNSTIAIALSGALLAAVPAAAAPMTSVAAQFKSVAAGKFEHVRWRGGGAVVGGFAAGMLLGGLIASSPYYYGGPPYYYGPPAYYPPGYYAPPDWEDYCFSRYRSFDPASGTYLGYDGHRHPCR